METREYPISDFTKLANLFEDKVNTVSEFQQFSEEFMKETKGVVNVDFLDGNNWDIIKKIDCDIESELIQIYFRQPFQDEMRKSLRKLAFSYDSYSLILKFSNVDFIRHNGICIAIIIRAYSFSIKQIHNYINERWGSRTLIAEDETYFSHDSVIRKDNVLHHIKFIKTPLISFWIIPKSLRVSAYESIDILYSYNLEILDQRINATIASLTKSIIGLTDKEDIEDLIYMHGNKLRRVAERLFKLIAYFYRKECKIQSMDYQAGLLGNIIASFIHSIYKNKKEELNSLVRKANELSHDTGEKVEPKDVNALAYLIRAFISDFDTRLKEKKQSDFTLDEPRLPSPSDFIKDNLQKWNFIDEINDSVRGEDANCNFLIVIRKTSIANVRFSDDDFLCADGYVRNLNYNNLFSALVVNNRESVCRLHISIDKKVFDICKEKGYDLDSAHVNFRPILRLKNRPSYLFTFDDIHKLLSSADDSIDNLLVIDENGSPLLISDMSLGHLYPVYHEPFYAGNGSLGSQSDPYEERNTYLYCLRAWLVYLETGRSCYVDYYDNLPDELTLLKKIKKFYD